MCAVVLHEYIDENGKIRHRRGMNIWPTYADAIYEFVDYFDTWYLSTEAKRLPLPPDMRILYETDGFTWDQFMLARNIIDMRLMYDAYNDFNYLDKDFIVGPGVYVYPLDEIPLGFSYLFDSTILFGGKSGKKNPSKPKTLKVKDKYKLPPGFKDGTTIVAGLNRGSPFKTVGIDVTGNKITGKGSALDDLDDSDNEDYSDNEPDEESSDSYSESSDFIGEGEFDSSDMSESEENKISKQYGFSGAGGFHLPPSIAGNTVRNFNANISGAGEQPEYGIEDDTEDTLESPPSFNKLRESFMF